MHFPSLCADLVGRINEDGSTFEYASCRRHFALYQLFQSWYEALFSISPAQIICLFPPVVLVVLDFGG